MAFKPFGKKGTSPAKKKGTAPFEKKGAGDKSPFQKKGGGDKKSSPSKSGAKGQNTLIHRYPAEQSAQATSQPAADSGSAAAPDVSKSTNRGGKPNAAAAEPKLSPEAEAARNQQGAVTVLTATGPATTPPPDPRAHYQVGDEMDNTPLISFTTLASAAQQKGNPNAAIPAPKANADLKSGGKADEDEEDVEEEEPEDDEEDEDEEE